MFEEPCHYLVSWVCVSIETGEDRSGLGATRDTKGSARRGSAAGTRSVDRDCC